VPSSTFHLCYFFTAAACVFFTSLSTAGLGAGRTVDRPLFAGNLDEEGVIGGGPMLNTIIRSRHGRLKKEKYHTHIVHHIGVGKGGVVYVPLEGR